MRIGRIARKLEIKPTEIIDFLSNENIPDLNSNTRLKDPIIQKVLSQFSPTTSLLDLQNNETSIQTESEIHPTKQGVEEGTNTYPEQNQEDNELKDEKIDSVEKPQTDLTKDEGITLETNSKEVPLVESPALDSTSEVKNEQLEMMNEPSHLELSEDSSDETLVVEKETIQSEDSLTPDLQSSEILENDTRDGITEENEEKDIQEEIADNTTIEKTNLHGLEISEDEELSRPELHALAGLKVIRAPKVSLPGVKVVGKIDLPEPKKNEDPEDTQEKENGSEEKVKAQPTSPRHRKHKQLQKARKERVPLSERLEREKEAKERQAEKQKQLEKRKKKEYYEKRLETTAKTLTSKKKKKKKPIRSNQKQNKNLNVFQRFVRWLNS